MTWRPLAAVMVVATLMTANGCSRTVVGSAERGTGDGPAARGYGYSDDRCGLLDDATVRETVGAEDVVRPYSGAVCQYVLASRSTIVDLTYSWFETGSLDRERQLAEATGAQIADVDVQRHQAFAARRSVTGNACSATAATRPGVASWWVQIRADASIDPCRIAQQLLAQTLSADM